MEVFLFKYLELQKNEYPLKKKTRQKRCLKGYISLLRVDHLTSDGKRVGGGDDIISTLKNQLSMFLQQKSSFTRWGS